MSLHQTSDYFIALSLLKSINKKFLKDNITTIDLAREIFETSLDKLRSIKIADLDDIKKIVSGEILRIANDFINNHQSENTKITTYIDENYPLRLKNIKSAPLLLFSKGSFDINTKKTVAIIGTRSPSSYAKRVVKTVISQLSIFNPIIVSGLAYGIDIEAHKYALDCGLETVAVCASGVNIVYPSDHYKISEEISKRGSVVSEYPNSTTPEKYRFLERNKIVAGIADAVVVIEASDKSGSLVTADYAIEYSKEIFVVPGSIFEENCRGSNKLAKAKGVNLLTSVDEISNVLQWRRPKYCEQLRLF